MGKRTVTILDNAVEAVASISFFIESKGLPDTAKRFVDDAFDYFEKLSIKNMIHKPCSFPQWKLLNYRCVNYKKKYVVAYITNDDEIIIVDFVSAKLLHY